MNPFGTKDIVYLSFYPSLIIILHGCTVIQMHLEESLGLTTCIFQIDIKITPESLGIRNTEDTICGSISRCFHPESHRTTS